MKTCKNCGHKNPNSYDECIECELDLQKKADKKQKTDDPVTPVDTEQ